MTAYQVEAIAPRLTAFLQPLERFFDTPKTVRHFCVPCRMDSASRFSICPGRVGLGGAAGSSA